MQMNVVAEHGGSWRRLVLERRLQEELEDAPLSTLEGPLRVARLGGHVVRRLRLRLRRLLQIGSAPAGQPLPLTPGWTPDLPHELRDLPMMDSEVDALEEDLGAVLGYLVNLEVKSMCHYATHRRLQVLGARLEQLEARLEAGAQRERSTRFHLPRCLQELDVMFGMHDFEKNLSEPPNVVKVASCRALGKALSALRAFRRLRWVSLRQRTFSSQAARLHFCTGSVVQCKRMRCCCCSCCCCCC